MPVAAVVPVPPHVDEPEPASVAVIVSESPPAIESEPASVAAVIPEPPPAVAPEPPPAVEQPAARSPKMPATETVAPFPMNLRGQASGSDARAERLIRQIRGEVENLRQTLDEMANAQEDMVAVDLDAVVADPAAAAGLPPAVLVRGLVSSAGKIAALNAEMSAIGESVKRLQALNHDLEIEHSFNRGRLETLDEVVAALHGNLQDLRFERDQVLLMVNGRANGNGNGNGAHGQLHTTATVLEPRAND